MSKLISLAGHSATTRGGLVARLAIAGVAGVVGGGLTSGRAAATTTKLPPNEIGYQASPKANALRIVRKLAGAKRLQGGGRIDQPQRLVWPVRAQGLTAGPVTSNSIVW